jgi:hypothetical protein
MMENSTLPTAFMREIIDDDDFVLARVDETGDTLLGQDHLRIKKSREPWPAASA